jgi:hypothetical protein
MDDDDDILLLLPWIAPIWLCGRERALSAAVELDMIDTSTMKAKLNRKNTIGWMHALSRWLHRTYCTPAIFIYFFMYPSNPNRVYFCWP